MLTTSDAQTVLIAFGADAAPPRRAVGVPNASVILRLPESGTPSGFLSTFAEKA